MPPCPPYRTRRSSRSAGEVSQYTVVRINDEITVDLTRSSASSINHDEAKNDIVIREISGVPIPFASPRLLYRMKEKTHREERPRRLTFPPHHYGDEDAGRIRLTNSWQLNLGLLRQRQRL